MVARASQHVGTSQNMHSENPMINQGRDTQIAGAPRHPRKETSTPKPSQDAELKDYVCHPTALCILQTHPHMFLSSNLETALVKEPLVPSLGQ